MTENEIRLDDGTVVRTGLLLPDERAVKVAATYADYPEKYFKDKSDIEKSLKGDVYKQMRKRRQRFITNQGGLSQCNASATVNAFHNRRDLDGMPHVVLSSTYLYMHINGGKDRGSMLADGFEFSKQGIAPRILTVKGEKVTFPGNVYLKRQVSSELLAAANAEAQFFSSWEAFKLPKDNFETFKIALASALANDHQVIHAWHVGRASSRLSNGYVQQGRGNGNHATLFHSGKWVGGADLVHPDCENSWGPSVDPMYGPVGSGWGDNGFGLFTMQSAFQCTRYHDFWVLTGNKINERSLAA